MARRPAAPTFQVKHPSQAKPSRVGLCESDAPSAESLRRGTAMTLRQHGEGGQGGTPVETAVMMAVVRLTRSEVAATECWWRWRMRRRRWRRRRGWREVQTTLVGRLFAMHGVCMAAGGGGVGWCQGCVGIGDGPLVTAGPHLIANSRTACQSIICHRRCGCGCETLGQRDHACARCVQVATAGLSTCAMSAPYCPFNSAPSP